MRVKVNGSYQVMDDENNRHVADDGPFDLSDATAREYLDRGYVTEVKSEPKSETKSTAKKTNRR